MYADRCTDFISGSHAESLHVFEKRQSAHACPVVCPAVIPLPCLLFRHRKPEIPVITDDMSVYFPDPGFFQKAGPMPEKFSKCCRNAVIRCECRVSSTCNIKVSDQCAVAYFPGIPYPGPVFEVASESVQCQTCGQQFHVRSRHEQGAGVP